MLDDTGRPGPRLHLASPGESADLRAAMVMLGVVNAVMVGAVLVSSDPLLWLIPALMNLALSYALWRTSLSQRGRNARLAFQAWRASKRTKRTGRGPLDAHIALGVVREVHTDGSFLLDTGDEQVRVDGNWSEPGGSDPSVLVRIALGEAVSVHGPTSEEVVVPSGGRLGYREVAHRRVFTPRPNQPVLVRRRSGTSVG